MGTTTTPNSMGTVRGSNSVPNVSPRALAIRHASGSERDEHQPVDVQVHRRGRHELGDREDEQRGEQALEGPG